MHEKIYRDNLDEADQRKMADSLVAKLIQAQQNTKSDGFTAISVALFNELTEENRVLKILVERYLTAINEAIYSMHHTNYGAALKTLRVAAFATFPDKDAE